MRANEVRCRKCFKLCTFHKKAKEASFKKLNDILNKEILQIGFAFVNFVTNCFKCCFIATYCTLAFLSTTKFTSSRSTQGV